MDRFSVENYGGAFGEKDFVKDVLFIDLYGAVGTIDKKEGTGTTEKLPVLCLFQTYQLGATFSGQEGDILDGQVFIVDEVEMELAVFEEDDEVSVYSRFLGSNTRVLPRFNW